VILGAIQSLIIPKIVKFLSDSEVYFTNSLHMGFSTGTILYFLLLFTSLTAFIAYTVSKKESHYKIGLYALIGFTLIVVISAPRPSSMFMRALCMGGIIYAIGKIKAKHNSLNIIMMSLATILIGYSSFFILVIRSQANPPMDENDPENAPNMLSYLLSNTVTGQFYTDNITTRQRFRIRNSMMVILSMPRMKPKAFMWL
jgi:hypothetical protein